MMGNVEKDLQETPKCHVDEMGWCSPSRGELAHDVKSVARSGVYIEVAEFGQLVAYVHHFDDERPNWL